MTRPLLFKGARVLTMGDVPGPRRGAAMRDLRPLDLVDLLVEDGSITRIGGEITAPAGGRVIDAGGRVLMPGFVDCHTHACWAGDRLDEWERKLAGATYLELLAEGGGIMSTVRAVRDAADAELTRTVRTNLDLALRHGTTTIEVKSGYGLTTEDELRMLHAIKHAAADWAGTVVLTACIGHALDSEQDDQIARTIGETLPAVHAEFPGIAIDAYCEQGAWSLGDCLRLFERARELGHPIRVHADQFNDLGMIPAAVSRGFVSVDHLEASSVDHLAALAESETFGVMLPCSGFHTDGRYAEGRAFVDGGGALAIATNHNPGSSPCAAMPMAVALGTRFLGLTPAEAVTASTTNPAALLGLDDRGRLTPGARADLILLHHTDERMLAHDFGCNPIAAVVCAGELIVQND